MAMDAKQVAAGAMAVGYGQDQALAMAQQCMMDNAMLQMMETVEASVDAELERAENLSASAALEMAPAPPTVRLTAAHNPCRRTTSRRFAPTASSR